MTLDELLISLKEMDIGLCRSGSELIIVADQTALTAPLIDQLHAHKIALLQIVEKSGNTWGRVSVQITPEMLPLVELTQGEIEQAVNGVTGGAANVQDIYPLAPLQEGILFHHLIEGGEDPYLVSRLYAFESRARVDEYLEALQAVIDRHDILRTSIAWEGLCEPVQVVWRKAVLPVEEVELAEGGGDGRQLYERFTPRRYRMNVCRAPMLRGVIAEDREQARWLLLLQNHHLIGDHATQEVLQEEVEAYLLGDGERLPEPLPFRNLVAQARLGVSREAHEAYFRRLLGDVEEPTTPFGLLNVQGDGRGIEQARMRVDGELGRRLREQAKRLGVSAASVCHAAYGRMLAQVSGRSDVVFGTVLFGRMQGGEGSERVMGLFLNTLPVRMKRATKVWRRACAGCIGCWRSCCSTSMRRWRWRSAAAACRRRSPCFPRC